MELPLIFRRLALPVTDESSPTHKRGINGVYHHVSAEHLHRYLSEFDFRYNSREMTDGARTVLALQKAEGKRLKYRALEA